ncbi:hypothetical protein K438DRAFT_1579374, partial [Mycena galopus ATCC 62051]
FPHRLTVEDEHNGYRLPASTIIHPNAWSVNSEAIIYPDPASFKPEQFEARRQHLDSAAGMWVLKAFPRKYLAHNSIWINAASILVTFNITKTVGNNGQVIEPTHEYFSALVSYVEILI